VFQLKNTLDNSNKFPKGTKTVESLSSIEAYDNKVNQALVELRSSIDTLTKVQLAQANSSN
jgi:hypothetical protein